MKYTAPTQMEEALGAIRHSLEFRVDKSHCSRDWGVLHKTQFMKLRKEAESEIGGVSLKHHS